MNTKHWGGEDFWIKLIEKGLYPPEAITKSETIKSWLSAIDLQGKRFLDHGCGTGIFGALAKERGASVSGIDISERLVQEAAKHIDATQADAAKLPFADKEFDFVLSAMVLHILEDIQTPLREIARVLKPGGQMLLGIVHPFSEKWDAANDRPYSDNSTYGLQEKRTWIFNLTDGTRTSAEYFHRPLESWLNALIPLFEIQQIAEPALSSEYLSTGKYAATEYLFFQLTRR